jgi:hypothetical protein
MQIFFALFLFAPSCAHAEYRVFELVITNTQTKAERVVASTLDPFQYPGYYEVKPEETVKYRDTWMCWGDTSNYAPLCPNPKTLTQSPVKK